VGRASAKTSVGATGELIEVVAGKMVAEKKVRIDRAEEIVKEVGGMK